MSHVISQQQQQAPAPDPALAITEKQLLESDYRQFNPGAIAGASCIYRKQIQYNTAKYALRCSITWFPEITKSGAERPEKYEIEFALVPGLYGRYQWAPIKLQLTGEIWQQHTLSKVEDMAVKFAERMADFVIYSE